MSMPPRSVRRVDPALFKESVSCRSCHQQAFDQWSYTGHARSWETLVAKGKERNPECISCHTSPFDSGTDLGKNSGVGCATCHGDSTLHSLDPSTLTGLVRRPAAQTCKTCHDVLNSPHFSYAVYMKKVRHK